MVVRYVVVRGVLCVLFVASFVLVVVCCCCLLVVCCCLLVVVVVRSWLLFVVLCGLVLSLLLSLLCVDVERCLV